MSKVLQANLNNPVTQPSDMSEKLTEKARNHQSVISSLGVRDTDNVVLLLEAGWKKQEDRFTMEQDVMGMRFKNDSERRLVRVMLDIFFEFPVDINLVAIRRPPTRRFELRVKDKDTAGISARLLRDIAIKLENADFSIYWIEPKADALNIKIEDLDHALRVFSVLTDLKQVSR